MKLKLTEYVEATNEEIGDAFGQMDAGDQAELLEALEEGLFKACKGDIGDVVFQYNAIAIEIENSGKLTGITMRIA